MTRDADGEGIATQLNPRTQINLSTQLLKGIQATKKVHLSSARSLLKFI